MKANKKTLGQEIKDCLIGPMWLILLASTPFTAISIRNTFQNIDNPPYNSRNWQRDLEVEKKNLGLEGVVIKVNIKESSFLKSLLTTEYAFTERKGDGTYLITLKEYRGRRALRHELYHVYELENGTLPLRFNMLEILLAEWRAQDYVDGKLTP